MGSRASCIQAFPIFIKKLSLIQNTRSRASHALSVCLWNSSRDSNLCMSPIFIDPTSETHQLFCSEEVIVLSPWERGLAQTCLLTPPHRCPVKEKLLGKQKEVLEKHWDWADIQAGNCSCPVCVNSCSFYKYWLMAAFFEAVEYL